MKFRQNRNADNSGYSVGKSGDGVGDKNVRRHQEILKDPVSRLISLASSQDAGNGEAGRGRGGRYIIGLAGYPGSGKTTICQHWLDEVKAVCGENSIMVLGMDGFHRSKAELRAMDNPEEAFARRGVPYTFNPTLFIEKLHQLRDSVGKDVLGWPGFEHEVGDPVDDAISVNPDCRLILVEGIYILLRQDEWMGLEGLFDETWFLDTDLETAMQRLYIRHQQAWGLSEEQAKKRADGNDRLNCQFIRPGRETADFLVDPGTRD